MNCKKFLKQIEDFFMVGTAITLLLMLITIFSILIKLIFFTK